MGYHLFLLGYWAYLFKCLEWIVASNFVFFHVAKVAVCSYKYTKCIARFSHHCVAVLLQPYKECLSQKNENGSIKQKIQWCFWWRKRRSCKEKLQGVKIFGYVGLWSNKGDNPRGNVVLSSRRGKELNETRNGEFFRRCATLTPLFFYFGKWLWPIFVSSSLAPK